EKEGEEEEKKRPDVDDDDDKPEKVVEEAQRDPDEMVFAEQAIQHYAEEVLARFVDAADGAFSMVNSFISSQADVAAMNDTLFLEGLASQMGEQLMAMFGGAGSPIADAVSPILIGQAEEAARYSDVLSFVGNVGSAVRDSAWYIRDNLQSVL